MQLSREHIGAGLIASNAVLVGIVALMLSKMPMDQKAAPDTVAVAPVEVAEIEPTSPEGMKRASDVITAMAKANGQEVVASFDAEGEMRGFLLSKGFGDANLIYVNPEGSVMLQGPLMSIEGENLSDAHLQAYLPKPDFTEAFASLQERAEVAGMITGEGDSELFVVYEPHCSACMALHNSIGDDQTKVTWMPVSFLSPDSPAVALAMVESENPEKTLSGVRNREAKKQMADQYRDRMAEGKAITDENWKIASQFGVRGTPALIWRDQESGEIQVYTQVPTAEKYQEIVRSARKA